jgi:hypothetical protein
MSVSRGGPTRISLPDSPGGCRAPMVVTQTPPGDRKIKFRCNQARVRYTAAFGLLVGCGNPISQTMQRPAARRLVAHAAIGKINLSALATVTALACASGLLGLIAAGIVLYALLIARDASSPRFRRRLLAADAEALRRLPDTSSLTDQSLRETVCSLRSGYTEIERVLKQTPQPIRAHVRVAASALDDLRGPAAQAVRDADDLFRYLQATPRHSLEREMKRLQEAIEHAEPDGLRDYQQAVAVREEQIATIDRIKRERERLVASLQFIVATIEAFPSRISRLRLLETRAKQDVVKEIHEQLARIDLDVSSSQHLLDEMAEHPDDMVTADGRA